MPSGKPLTYLFGLGFDTCQRVPFFLCFDDTSDFAANVEAVIGRSSLQRELPNGNAKTCRDIHVREVLNIPARTRQHLIDILAC